MQGTTPGVELEEDRDGEEEAGEDRLFAIAGEEREGDESHRGRVEVAGAGDLPDEDGAPGVEESLLSADSQMTEERDEGVCCDAFEEDHRGLHEGNGGGDPGDEIEEGLCGWWVDGVGVVAAVDVVEELLMRCAEEGESRVAGDVAVGADVGVLHDAVPDVAVDVGGEKGFGEEDGEAAGYGDGEDDGEGEAVDWLREDEEGRC